MQAELPSYDHHPYYEKLSRALDFIAQHWRQQPSLDEIAAHAALSPHHFQRIFVEWVGISPKQLCALLTHEQAAIALRTGKSLLDVALDHGLSGTSRLHDLFLKIETMTPGEYKRQGDSLTLSYGFFMTPFGEALIVISPRGLAGLVFVDGQSKTESLALMQAKWPQSRLVLDQDAIIPYHQALFKANHQAGNSIALFLKGTPFQLKLWQALIALPAASLSSYGALGAAAGFQNAGIGRAVGGAVGANPISWVIPCHRILSSDALLGGYRWGLPRK
ncbi:MAG: methylated-DNA--[protein]-cysteine S-methyltransferase, partial [Alphaproteobacteria bacterium]